MTFSTKSSLWNDIELKDILSYKTISSIQSSNKTNVSRKLFQSNTTDQLTNKLTINRNKSDGIVENNDKKHIKLSPYTMFYRKFYEYVLSRLDLICYRLYGSQSNKYEKIIWNLFENYTQLLFRSRLIQVYKSMPNSKLKTVRNKNLKENQLIDLPYSNKTFENIKSGHVNVNISSINYSSNKTQTNSTSNVLSSSIQVARGDQGNVICRFIHTYFVPLLPSIHCPHVGSTGGGACADKTIDFYYNQTNFLACGHKQ
ncbi:unnamed protein product [Rotaria sp. Silwood1]|nr:unnamed protein product [Rotaria sp. Silwood1]CAF1686453.1 unnamed protein product [Rotaria sp. Silwood1]